MVDGDGEGANVMVTLDGPVVVLTPTGCLDKAAGEALLRAAEQAIASGASRLDVDLRSIVDSTPEGAASLVTARVVAAGLAEGLHYRTGRGAGRAALLAAYTDSGAASP